MEIRQALEAAGTDVFLDAATVRGLLPEARDDGRGPLHVLRRRRAQLRVGDARRPRPGGAAAELRPVLVWWMCERAQGGKATVTKSPTPRSRRPTSASSSTSCRCSSRTTPPAPSSEQKPAEQASFGRALRNIGLLYGHAGSVVFKMTKTPLPAGGDPDRVYEKRGWCHLEQRLGDLEARRRTTSTSRRGRRPRPSAPPGKMPRRRSAGRRSCASRTALFGDRFDTISPGTLGALTRGGRARP